MNVRSFRIPSVVTLPGLTVKVRVVPPRQIGGATGVWLYDEEGEACILLNSRRPLTVQRYTLWHELLHCLNDLIDQGLERFPKVIQTKRMARAAKRKR